MCFSKCALTFRRMQTALTNLQVDSLAGILAVGSRKTSNGNCNICNICINSLLDTKPTLIMDMAMCVSEQTVLSDALFLNRFFLASRLTGRCREENCHFDLPFTFIPENQHGILRLTTVSGF